MARRSGSVMPSVSRASRFFIAPPVKVPANCFQSDALAGFASSKIFPLAMPSATNASLSVHENSVGSSPSMNRENALPTKLELLAPANFPPMNWRRLL